MLQLKLEVPAVAGKRYRIKESSPGDTRIHVKQSVQALLDRLPDDCSLDNVQYHLYVLQSIERGRADARPDGRYPIKR